ncbi:hypothetical protein D9756_003547 [Leucocoprinus leucothites]|uniref:Glycan binding protein Y3-like domain-containing protein n=1 Tax=Leucocoprinus leucothites TaxID=201217 RepID=A0A8H5G6W5_9AGAR|nr:hypothetical protein D9756_003547 [Leucoagaricus leucothites]
MFKSFVLASFIVTAMAQNFPNGPTPTFGQPPSGVGPTFGFPSTTGQMPTGQPSSVNCYGKGLTPASDCNQFVQQFCASVANTQYPSGDSASACFNQQNGNRCDFIAYNTNTNTNNNGGFNNGGFNNGNFNVFSCQSVLQNISGRCQSGGWGQQTAGDWTFTVDPNRGRCGSDVQGGN